MVAKGFIFIIVILFSLFIYIYNYHFEKSFNMYIYEDNSMKMGFNQIKNQKFDKRISNTFSLGYKKSSIWFKFKVDRHEDNLIMTLNEHFLDNVRIFFYDKYNNLITYNEKSDTPIKNRKILTKNIVFPINNLLTNEPIYINIKSEYSIKGKINIYGEREFIFINNFNYNSIIFILISIFLIIAIFNIFVFIKNKDKLNLLFVFLIISYSLYLFINSGLYIYFNLEKCYWLNHITTQLSVICLILFSISYLNIKNTLSNMFKFMILNIFFLIIVSILSFFYYKVISRIDGFIAMYIVLIIIYLGFYKYYKEKNSNYLLFVSTHLLLFFSILIYEMLLFGYLNYTVLSRYLLIFSLFFQIMIFSYLLLKYYIAQEEKLNIDEIEKIKEENTNFDNILKETNHRIKNNFHFLNSILHIENKKNRNELFVNLISRINSISELHDNLYNSKKENLNFDMYLDSIINKLMDLHKNIINLTIEKYVDENINLEKSYYLYLGVIINELITNSMKHNKNINHLQITIKLQKNYDGMIQLIVMDNGVGFDTNKKYDSLGQNIIKSFCNKLENCTCNISINDGTIFRFNFYEKRKKNGLSNEYINC